MLHGIGKMVRVMRGLEDGDGRREERANEEATHHLGGLYMQSSLSVADIQDDIQQTLKGVNLLNTEVRRWTNHLLYINSAVGGGYKRYAGSRIPQPSSLYL
jgi:hypothetical protein